MRRMAIVLVTILAVLTTENLCQSESLKKEMREVDRRLIEAVENSNLERVKSLLDKGADVNTRNEFGGTPLHLAQKKAVVEVLISKGAMKNAKTLKRWSIFPTGSTPLDVAEGVRFYEMAAYLKTKGCKRGSELK